MNCDDKNMPYIQEKCEDRSETNLKPGFKPSQRKAWRKAIPGNLQKYKKKYLLL